GREAVDLEVREAPEQRLVDRLRRLVDLLEHKMVEAALLRVLEGPGDPLRVPMNRLPFQVLDRHLVRRDDDHLSVHDVQHAVRVPQEGGTSDARKFSSGPTPTTSGLSFRAPTTLPGSSAWIARIAYDPRASCSAFRVASSRFPS